MQNEGFTLFELNVCSVIIIVIIAISYPSLGAMRNSFALRDEICVLRGNLQRAKIEAIKNNNHVVFELNDNGYTVFVDDGAGGGRRGDWVKQPNEQHVVDHIYGNGVKLYATTFSGRHIRFNGRPAIKGGRVILSNTDGALSQVVVSRLSRIRTEKL